MDRLSADDVQEYSGMLKNLLLNSSFGCLLMYAYSLREWNGPWDRIGKLPKDTPNERYPNKISLSYPLKGGKEDLLTRMAYAGTTLARSAWHL